MLDDDRPDSSRLLGFAVATVLVEALLAFAVVTQWAPLFDLDQTVARPFFAFTSAHQGVREAALIVQTAFAVTAMTAYAIVAALALLVVRRRIEAAVVVAVMAASTLADNILKILIGRDRPHWSHPITHLTSPSFPSGHSCAIAAASGLSILLVMRLSQHRSARRLVVAAALAFAGLVGLDRLLLGVHYLSDVVGGLALGTAVVLVGGAALGAIDERRSLRRDSLSAVE